MSNVILKYRVDPKTSFVSLLKSMEKLPFKIPVTNPKHVSTFPEILELGYTEYGSAIDMWLDATVSPAISETATVMLDGYWQIACS